jgi:hypothetical protein
MLVKVQASGYGREEVKRNTEIFRGQIIDVTPSIYTVQLAGTSDKLDAFWLRCAMSLGLLKWLAPAWSACRAAIKSCAEDRELIKIARHDCRAFFAKSVGTVAKAVAALTILRLDVIKIPYLKNGYVCTSYPRGNCETG